MDTKTDYGTRIRHLEDDVRQLKINNESILSDIKDIRDALLGNDYNDEGITQIVRNNNKDIQELKTQKRIEKAAIVAGGTVIGFILTKGLEIIYKIF